MRIAAIMLLALTLPASAENLCDELLKPPRLGKSSIQYGLDCDSAGNCATTQNYRAGATLGAGRKYRVAAILPGGYAQSTVAIKVRVLRSVQSAQSTDSEKDNHAVTLRRDAIPFACGSDRNRKAYPMTLSEDDEDGISVGYKGYDGYHRSGRSSRAERRAIDNFHIRYGSKCVSTNDWKLRPYFLFDDQDQAPGFLARLFHVDPNAGKAIAQTDTPASRTVQYRVRMLGYQKDPQRRACVVFPLTTASDEISIEIVDLGKARDAQGPVKTGTSASFKVE